MFFVTVQESSTPALTPGSSPCPTSYLLDTVGSDKSLRKPMTTNQLSLLRTPIVRFTQFRQASGSAASGSRFDALRPCVFASLRFKGVGLNAERQSRHQRSWATDGTPIKHGK